LVAGTALLAVAAAIIMLSGCAAGGTFAGDPAATATPTQPLAELAGGACRLLDFEEVTAAVGIAFDAAAAGQDGDTYTCVLEHSGKPLPDLSLTVTPTDATIPIFRGSAVPKGSTLVGDLGKMGYSLPIAAHGVTGPGVEVGWLSGNGRLIILRVRLGSGASASGLAGKVVGLAKSIDAATG
jgi:hypothetical protein